MSDQEWYQQGDVTIKPVESTKMRGGRTVEAKARGFVLAEGEHTGHAHVIDRSAEIEFVEVGGKFFIRNAKPVTVTHEEHKPVTFPAGTWEIGGVKEYDHMENEARKVRD